MIGFFATMFVCQFFIMAIVFPYMNQPSEQWLKTAICAQLGAWLMLAAIVQALGPGVIKRDKSVSLMDLLEEFDVREICPTCSIIILPRSRHCNICNSCVDRFDHHCQWLNNCVGRRNHPFFLAFVMVQATYLFFVTGTLIKFYTDLFHSSHSGTPLTTCDSEGKHFADLCLIVTSPFFRDNEKSRILLYVISVVVFLLASGFALPVLNLFILQARNFSAGQTSIERLGKQQGKKVSLEHMFNVNEPLLNPATPLVETRFLYREIVKEAQ